MARKRKKRKKRERGRKQLKAKHIKIAKSTRMVDRMPEITPEHTPQMVVEEAFAQIKKLGVRIERRRAGKPAVTLRRVMYLPEDFEERPIIEQARWIRHELLHLWQHIVEGVRFPIRWAASARWRCAYELEAGGEGMRTLNRFIDQRAMRRVIKRRAHAFSDDGLKSTYKLGALHQKRTYDLAHGILLESVGLT